MKHLFLLFLFLLGNIVNADTVITPFNSSWKYLDNGTNQGTAWRPTLVSGVDPFNDTTWASGNGILGYGTKQNTTVSFGPSSTFKYITTYFRKIVSIPDPSLYIGITLRLVCDDGSVVYVNGVEVARSNLPAGTISSSTLASAAVSGVAETAISEYYIPLTSFIAGNNTIAVEVHQAAITSSDIYFDLSVVGATIPIITRGPYLQNATDTGISVRWRTNYATPGRLSYGTLFTNIDDASNVDHNIRVTGLTANSLYQYKVGTPTTVLSTTNSFSTNPTPGSTTPFRFWVLGDSGVVGAGQTSVANAANTYAAANGGRENFILLLGDNAYNSGFDSEYQTNFFTPYATTLLTKPFWPTIGNHETNQSAAPASTIAYFKNFTTPAAGEAGGQASASPRYYSFNYGNAHFVCLDSMASSRTTTGAQALWLENDLAQNTQKWLIVFFHHPPYSKGSHDSDTDTIMKEMRTNFMPILEQYGVDLTLTGHCHAYERSNLVNGHYGLSTTFNSSMLLDNDSDFHKPAIFSAEQGAINIVSGSAAKVEDWTDGTTTDIPVNPHPIMKVSYLRLGSVLVDINNNIMTVKFISSTGTVDDSVTIKKDIPNTPPVVSTNLVKNRVALGHPITLAANATDSDGTVKRVDYYDTNSFIGSVNTSGFNYSWTPLTLGVKTINTQVFDNLGGLGNAESVTLNVLPDPGLPPAPFLYNNNSTNLQWYGYNYETFNIYKANTPGGPYSLLASDVVGNEYTDNSNTVNYYVVTAVNLSGESLMSNEVNTVIPAPSTPTLNITFNNIGVALSWISERATSYKVYRASTSMGLFALLTTTTNAYYTDIEGATNTFYYKVIATNNTGDSSESNSVNNFIPPATPPYVYSTKIVGRDYVVSWTGSTGATSYKILRSNSLNGAYSLIGSSNSLSYTDLGGAGQSFFYQVIASNATGDSPVSNSQNSVQSPQYPPYATIVVNTNNIVSYSPVDGATSYKVYKSSTLNGTYSIVNTSSSLSYSDSSGSAFYKVSASNSVGDSIYSNIVSSNIAPLSPPYLQSPALTGTLSLSWNPVSNTTLYNIYSSSSQDGTYSLLNSTANITFLTSFSGVVYYKITAVNAYGESSFSNIINSGEFHSAAPYIYDVSVVDNNVILSWNSAVGATLYKVYRSTSQNGTYSLFNTTSNLQINDIVSDTVYFYKIIASNAEGYSPESNIVTSIAIPQYAPYLYNSVITGNTVLLKWSPVSGATAYRVKVGEGDNYDNYSDFVITSELQAVITLPDSGFYNAIIVPHNLAGYGTPSNKASFSVILPEIAYSTSDIVNGNKITGFGIPSVGENGDLAFRGMFGLKSGIVNENKGTNLILAGLSNSFTFFREPYKNGNNTFFWAKTTSEGLWVTDGATLTNVVKVGSVAPLYNNLTSKFATLGSYAASNSSFIFSAALTPTVIPVSGVVPANAITTSNDLGLWTYDLNTASLNLVLRDGQRFTVGSKSLVVSSILAPTSPLGSLGQGNVLLNNSFFCRVGFSDKSTGIVKISCNAGVVTYSNVLLANLSEVMSAPQQDDLGRAVFNKIKTVTKDTTDPSTGIITKTIVSVSGSIYRWDGTTLETIQTIGTVLPNTTTTLKVASLGSPVVGSKILYPAKLALVKNLITSANNSVLVCNNSIVARSGDIAPGSNNGVFKAFTNSVITNTDRIVISASLVAPLAGSNKAGVSLSNDTGIWAVDSNHELKLILREGTTLNNKIIKSINGFTLVTGSNGVSRSAVGDYIAVKVVFKDLSQSIVKVKIP